MNKPIKAQFLLRNNYRNDDPIASATIDAKMNVHRNRHSTTPEGASQEPEAGGHQ